MLLASTKLWSSEHNALLTSKSVCPYVLLKFPISAINPEIFEPDIKTLFFSLSLGISLGQPAHSAPACCLPPCQNDLEELTVWAWSDRTCSQQVLTWNSFFWHLRWQLDHKSRMAWNFFGPKTPSRLNSNPELNSISSFHIFFLSLPLFYSIVWRESWGHFSTPLKFAHTCVIRNLFPSLGLRRIKLVCFTYSLK